MSKWQPIETAPKDGTEILLCTFDMDGYYSKEVTIGYYDDDGSNYCWKAFIDDWGRCNNGLFTHWMPLPEPPMDSD